MCRQTWRPEVARCGCCRGAVGAARCNRAALWRQSHSHCCETRSAAPAATATTSTHFHFRFRWKSAATAASSTRREFSRRNARCGSSRARGRESTTETAELWRDWRRNNWRPSSRGYICIRGRTLQRPEVRLKYGRRWAPAVGQHRQEMTLALQRRRPANGRDLLGTGKLGQRETSAAIATLVRLRWSEHPLSSPARIILSCLSVAHQRPNSQQMKTIAHLQCHVLGFITFELVYTRFCSNYRIE